MMYHNQATIEYFHGNDVCVRLQEVERQVIITDEHYPGLAPETFLTLWYDTIKAVFLDAKPWIVKVTKDGASTVACMN